MGKINETALSKINELGLERAAGATGKSLQAVKSWLRNGAVPGSSIDALLEAELPTVGYAGPEEEVLNAGELAAQAEWQASQEVDPTDARLQDLNERLVAIEQALAVIAAQKVQGDRPSNIRPNQSYGGAEPVVYGARTGVAPPRNIANNSATNPGTKRPAGPAQQPVPIKPGEPGNWGWNKTKTKPQTVQVLWPTNQG